MHHGVIIIDPLELWMFPCAVQLDCCSSEARVRANGANVFQVGLEMKLSKVAAKCGFF